MDGPGCSLPAGATPSGSESPGTKPCMGGLARAIAAVTNKCLAPSNESRTAGKATKKQNDLVKRAE
jgi:hypothetical protein